MQGVQETDFAKRWFVGPWLALLGLKLWLASRLPLFVDEAFYWQEGRHLAWAYSDLPGLTAWLARIGDGLGDGTLALRLPFLAIAAAIPWLVVRLAARELDPKAGWQAGTLALHGWHYVIEDGEVHVFDVQRGGFVPAAQADNVGTGPYVAHKPEALQDDESTRL